MSRGSNKQLEGGEGKQLFGQTSTGSQGQETATHHPAQLTHRPSLFQYDFRADILPATLRSFQFKPF